MTKASSLPPRRSLCHACVRAVLQGQRPSPCVNYGAAGNVDTEARILARYLPRHVAAIRPLLSRTRRAPAGLHAMNLLGAQHQVQGRWTSPPAISRQPHCAADRRSALKIKHVPNDLRAARGATGWTKSPTRARIRRPN